MKYVYVSSSVEHQIEILKQSGKTGRKLAEKTLRIIKNLTSNMIRKPEETIGNFTKYGEKRIRNCLKYDLGNGFRLISLYRNGHIYITYLGPHDACQRWLKNHTSIKTMDLEKENRFEISLSDHSFPKKKSMDIPLQNVSDEMPLDISDKELRMLFSGLIEGARKNKA